MKHNFIYLSRNNNITIPTTNKTKFWNNMVQRYRRQTTNTNQIITHKLQAFIHHQHIVKWTSMYYRHRIVNNHLETITSWRLKIIFDLKNVYCTVLVSNNNKHRNRISSSSHRYLRYLILVYWTSFEHLCSYLWQYYSFFCLYQNTKAFPMERFKTFWGESVLTVVVHFNWFSCNPNW